MPMQRSESSRGECLRVGHAVCDQLALNFGSATTATAASASAVLSATANTNAGTIADTATRANSGTTASADDDER